MDERAVSQIVSWVGLDVGKSEHHASVLSVTGEVRLERTVRNDEAQAARSRGGCGSCALVMIDQPGSIGSLAVCLARRRGVPVAYVWLEERTARSVTLPLPWKAVAARWPPRTTGIGAKL